MFPVAIAEFVSAAFVLVSLVSLFDRNDRSKSHMWLVVSLHVVLFYLIDDALSYSLLDKKYPFAFRYVLNLFSYSMGSLVMFFFSKYCKHYINERTPLKKWVFLVPELLLAGTIICSVILFFMGDLIVFEDEIAVVVNDLPPYLRAVQLFVMLYVPSVAIVKRKYIPFKAFILFCLFCVAPILAQVIALLTGGFDITACLGALSLILVADLLQKDETKNYLVKQQAELQKALYAAELEKRRVDVALDMVDTSIWSYKISANDEVVEACYTSKTRDRIEPVFAQNPMGWLDMLHPGDRNKTLTAFMAPIRDHSGKTKYDTTFRAMDKTGQYRVIKSGGSVLRHKDGTGEYVGMLLDITDQIKEQQKQLIAEEEYKREQVKMVAEASNRAKTEFLFNMSHDIRTPMNAIIGFTNKAIRHRDEEAVLTESLDKLKNSCDYLLGLVNNILDMASIESGKLVLNEQICHSESAKKTLLEVFTADASSKDINLHASYDTKDKWVWMDEVRTNQIIANLLSNAIKYTEPGGNIWYTVRQMDTTRDGYAKFVITVRDTGSGMDQEFLDKMFNSFERERTSENTTIQGTGLGMAIVKQLVNLMGGTIGVESEPGKGTTVIVEVFHRIATEDEIEAWKVEHAGANDHKQVTLKDKRILLVDDNTFNREIALDILSDQGAIVEEAEDGKVAVDLLMQKGPDAYDLVLMDIQMPVMDGYAATKAIRNMYPDSALPIIALSANAFAEDRQKSLEAGMNEHIAKPVKAEDLMDALRRSLYVKDRN